MPHGNVAVAVANPPVGPASHARSRWCVPRNGGAVLRDPTAGKKNQAYVSSRPLNPNQVSRARLNCERRGRLQKAAIPSMSSAAPPSIANVLPNDEALLLSSCGNNPTSSSRETAKQLGSIPTSGVPISTSQLSATGICVHYLILLATNFSSLAISAANLRIPSAVFSVAMASSLSR